jgi:pyrrolysine biosynthesis protein PylD
MTRLKSDDINDIVSGLDAYDTELLKKTNCTLMQLAIEAAGHDESHIRKIIPCCRAMVIPMTCGKGIIQGFSETLAAIATHIGFRGEVTTATDVAGLAEALKKKAEIIVLADDNQFIAVNLKTRHFSDNSDATGKGFATGLMLMHGYRHEKRVLVLGLGPVGQSAAREIIRRGGKVTLFDINRGLCREIADELKSLPGADVEVTSNFRSAVLAHPCILDATPAPGIIDTDVIRHDSMIASPGVPLGLTSGAREKVSGRLLHDPLQIGTATMLVAALK